MFKSCYVHGMFPSQWKYAPVNPVHKTDSKYNPYRYRPISLPSNISKVMEAVVLNQFQTYLLKNRLKSGRHYGVIPHHSTADILLASNHPISAMVQCFG